MTVKIKKDDSSPVLGGSNVVREIEIEGKVFKAEDVQNLINLQKSATEKLQSVSGITLAAQKYGVDVDTYLSQAEGAFSVMNGLIEQGVIDRKGNVQQKKDDGGGGKDVNDLENLFNKSGDGEGEKTPLVGEEKIASIVAKALGPLMDGMKKMDTRLSGVDQTQSDLIRLRLQDQMREKHKNLSEDDVSRIFGQASQDSKRSLWDFASEFSQKKTEDTAKLRGEHAKEFGINLENFDENKLKQQSAEGGAGAFIEGKKFSFDKRGEDVMTPLKAATAFIESQAAED
jgi:hypothetical protein